MIGSSNKERKAICLTMVFRKSWFFKALFACMCLIGWTDVSVAAYCINEDPPAGYFCKGSVKYKCRPGCFCLGSINGVGTIDVADACEERDTDDVSKWDALNDNAVYLCPDNYPESDAGAASSSECYTTHCAGVEKGYMGPYQCNPGYYLQAKHMICSRCEAGNRCADPDNPTNPRSYFFNCNEDQGIHACTDNQYSGAGAATCSTCGAGHYVNSGHTACLDCEAGYACGGDGTKVQCTGGQYSLPLAAVCLNCNGAGYAVTQTAGLNTGCNKCSAGYLPESDHSGCTECPLGYKCIGGLSYKCTGNQYADTLASTACTTCSGTGQGVQYGTGANNETINIDCDTCADGMYADQGICRPCPVGHRCTQGIDNGLCPAGTCAAINGACTSGQGATSCKTCPSGVSNDARTTCEMCANADEYVEDGICKNCPDIAFNTGLYERVQLSGSEYGFTGKAMCGISLKSDSICQDNSNVKWHVVNNSWALVTGSVAYIDVTSYLKNPAPNSPNGADADWCAECPTEPNRTFNVSLGYGESSCEACPAGYCVSGESCLPCQAGYFCPGVNGIAQECQWTDTNNEHGNLCSDPLDDDCDKICPKGTFSAPGQAQCSSCASGYTTQGPRTAYDPDTDSLEDICTKIQFKLKYDENNIIVLPELLRKINVNTSVINY